MRRYARRAVAALAITVALAVTGCVATPGGTKPTPSPSATPLFHSDEEALAAAEEAYAAYVSVTDAIFAEGGVGLDRLETVAAGEQLEADKTGFAEIAKSGYRSIGSTSFSDVSIQSVSADSRARETEVRVYLCEDVSAVQVLDASGVSVVAPGRPDRVRYEVSLKNGTNAASRLLVTDREVWAGGAC
jgi:hypothetical protein